MLIYCTIFIFYTVFTKIDRMPFDSFGFLQSGLGQFYPETADPVRTSLRDHADFSVILHKHIGKI